MNDIFQKIFDIDNPEGKEYIRISAVPTFNFFINITLVTVHQLLPKSNLNTRFTEYISSQILSGGTSDNSFFDIPVSTGTFQVDVHITADIGNGVKDITCRLIDKAEHEA